MTLECGAVVSPSCLHRYDRSQQNLWTECVSDPRASSQQLTKLSRCEDTHQETIGGHLHHLLQERDDQLACQEAFPDH